MNKIYFKISSQKILTGIYSRKMEVEFSIRRYDSMLVINFKK